MEVGDSASEISAQKLGYKLDKYSDGVGREIVILFPAFTRPWQLCYQRERSGRKTVSCVCVGLQ